MAYNQYDSNICFFSSLPFELTASGENNAARDIGIQIEKSLNFQYQGYKDRIAFDNDIMSDQVKKTGEKRLHNNINK